MVSDHDRGLTGRGKRSAAAIGAWLQREGFVPSKVYSSTAQRAKWTTALAVEELTPKPSVSFHAGLYHASLDRILAIIGEAPKGDLMVVGHNPGFAELAMALCTNRPAHPQFRRFPTAATLVLECEIKAWSDLERNVSRSLAFVVPRELGVE